MTTSPSLLPSPLNTSEIMKLAFLAFILLALALPGIVVAQEFSGFIEAETRTFPKSGLAEGQHGSNVSIAFEPELYKEWDRGYQSFTFTPFLRLDQGDGERTHFDIRELYWHKVTRNWELKAGITRVFWGVTESQHLVDVINQTDLVERPDGEAKLGQPMVNFTWVPRWGTFDFFVLPFFRERTFPGAQGRLRPVVPVDTDQTTYESGAKQQHVDVAARWSHSLSIFDVGLSHFYGTSREPLLLPGVDAEGQPVLTPHYNLVHQTGLDAQATFGGWLWKLEAITRSGQGKRFLALTTGFEYTFSNVRDSGIDVGVLAEYLYDGREKVDFGGILLSPALFEDDIFVGSRLAFNDVQSTGILGGVIVDRDTRSNALFLEGNRRLGDRWTLDLQLRMFTNTTPKDVLHWYRRDNYLQLGLAYHF